MTNLETNLGYTFKNRDLLLQALSHTSYAVENQLPMDNEKLEFLGDAVLQLTISEFLLQTFPKEGEGNLSHRRARLVREETLAEIAGSLGIPEALLLGKGEKQNGGALRPRLMASALEALFGAVFTESGFEAARQTILRVFETVLQENIHEIDFRRDYKTAAQEYVQKKYALTPTYVTEAEEGPSHNRTFKVALMIGSGVVTRGEGRSKKAAEQMAAKILLEEKL